MLWSLVVLAAVIAPYLIVVISRSREKACWGELEDRLDQKAQWRDLSRLAREGE